MLSNNLEFSLLKCNYCSYNNAEAPHETPTPHYPQTGILPYYESLRDEIS